KTLLWVIGGLAFFAALQGYLQFGTMNEAEAVPFNGEWSRKKTIGTPLDYGIMGGYFVAMLVIGTWFGKGNKTTKDFFFGGQRFSWWLIAFSLVATTVGSYSFVKYSNKGFGFGVSSSQTYLNDWMWFPLLAFGWLPILYFSRVSSVPEYFGRRFNSRVRLWATISILIYLVGYVGVNLFTMGKVLHHLVGWPVFLSALLVAVVSATYVTAGGQTSVIMTDLFQGVMLLLTGGLILFLGCQYLGGADVLWEHLPRGHRLAFPNFNQDPDFPAVGVFWQDGIANTAMFYFLNQGIIMRFLATKSLGDARKASFALMVVLMTVGACVVGGGGWVARALVHSGALPDTVKPADAFYMATEFLSRPGLFGLVLAALTAALMSTVDTLITAVASLAVNDVYRPYVRPQATERQMMRVARITSISVTIIGVALVPLFASFKSIYDAHGAFTASVTPPLVVALLLSVFWRRYTAKAAICTIVGGLALIFLSILVPQIITPFAHGVPMKTDVGDGLFAGMRQYKYMRACFGISVCSVIGVVVSLFTQAESTERQRGLVWGTIADAIRRYKGRDGNEHAVVKTLASATQGEHEPEPQGTASLPVIEISAALAESLGATEGDMLYICDTRWWLGGLNSTHAVIGTVDASGAEPSVTLGPQTYPLVVTPRREGRAVRIEKLY
ncbi:MAG: sodium/solute symporter, partial [Verrucomicrobia bacterium]|nr:sodium/solute symporter [Verrucomicrobiota bacterium]